MNIKSNLLSLFLRLVSVSIFVSAITLLSNLVVAKFSAKQVYSDFVIYQSYYLIISNFLPLGITAAIVFFRDRCSDGILFSIVHFYTMKVLPSLSCALVLLIYCSQKIAPLPGSFVILSFIIAAAYSQACINIIISFFQITEMYRLFQKTAIVNVLIYSLSLFISIFIFNDVLILFIVYACFSFFLFLYYFMKLLKLFDVSPIEQTLNKDIFVYAIPAAVNSVIISFLIAGDKVVLSWFVKDTNLIADYGYASFISSIFLFVVNNVATTIGVFLSQFKNSSFTLQEYCCRFRSFQSKNLLFFPCAVAFTPFIYVATIFLDVRNTEIFYKVAIILLLSYTLHGVAKLYLGFLNSFKKSFYILISGLFSSILVYAIVNHFYNDFGLLGIPFVFFLGSLAYLCLLLMGSYFEMNKHG